MGKHPEMKNMLSRLGVTTAFFLGWLGIAGLPGWAQDASPNVARVSFIQGSVQLMAGQGTDFQQAVMNMPVVDGSRLQTGADGEAEIEFGDGSVARLTPNSALQFDHLGQDQVQLRQLSGLTYYELNVGEGHAPFGLQFSNVNVQPTANTIMRVGLDAGWEVAVITGSVSVQGNGMAPANVAENQSIRSGGDNNGSPYTVAQGVNGDSWDNWNQDRDQAIAQEATQQTPVRDDAPSAQSENWNDLDADGNWYPVEGSGNVWVPAGTGADWDPYGAGYWGYYPSLGYTWISAYPWGWLPYHYGTWNYYSFGWGWSPGPGRGFGWSPVIAVHSHPPGWTMPIRPVSPGGGIYPRPGQRLVAVDRGPAAKGPWGFRGASPQPDHTQALSFRGAAIAPLSRVDVRSQAFTEARGTSPGTRTVLSVAPGTPAQRQGFTSTYTARGAVATRPMQPPVESQRVQAPEARPSVGYAAVNNNQRSSYTPREPSPAAHSSPPPAPAPRPAPAAAPRGAPSGGRR